MFRRHPHTPINFLPVRPPPHPHPPFSENGSIRQAYALICSGDACAFGDVRNGRGTYTYADGAKYVGEYKDDKVNGQGTYTFANGEKYVGEFKDIKKHGQGILYSANGSIKESGIYKDDKLVTSQYIDPNSFTRIARNNSAPAVSDSQRQAIEQRERQVELEAQRVAEERRRLDEDKRQREQAIQLD